MRARPRRVLAAGRGVVAATGLVLVVVAALAVGAELVPPVRGLPVDAEALGRDVEVDTSGERASDVLLRL
jgi:hypothetical protein